MHFGGGAFVIHTLLHSRPRADQNLRPIFQSVATWCSDDGRMKFQANSGLVAIGTISDGTSSIDVEVTVDIGACHIYVYLPAFTEDGIPVHDPSLDLEEWTFHSNGGDWFVVEVVKSTYYEKGDKITFYVQNDTVE